MMVTLEDHEAFCAESFQHYVNSRDPVEGALDWKEALNESRSLVVKALRASKVLYDVSGALQTDGGHMLVFRQMLAPPISQDQFKLICPSWPKASEKECRSLDKRRADLAALTFYGWRSPRLTPWLQAWRNPTRAELAGAIHPVTHLIAQQRVATARRNRIALLQENSVIQLLSDRGWTRLQSKMIDRRAEIPARHFMHKTRFVSGKNESQEVDVACGLGKTFVLAIECKVTNDETNSIKRINDVLKKAGAWKLQFGEYVKPACVIQGVVKFADIKRLLDANVEVFWSHRLDIFSLWLDQNIDDD